MGQDLGFNNMTLAQLLDAYNAMGGLLGAQRRSSPFRTLEEGSRLCLQRHLEVQAVTSSGSDPAPAQKGVDSGEVIRILTEPTNDDATAWRNPRQQGSAAHEFFSLMQDGQPVREYLEIFPEERRRDARRWLKVSENQGYIRMEDK